MAARALIERLLSPAGFGVALLFFLLPFATVACGTELDGKPSHVDMTFTGIDMITGSSPGVSITSPDKAGVVQTVTLDDESVAEFEAAALTGVGSQPLAVAAAVVIFAGMVLSLLLPVARRMAASLAVAPAAAVLLAVQVVVLAPRLASDEASRNEGLADLDQPYTLSTRPAVGFYLAVAALVAVAVGHLATRHSRAPAVPAPGGGPPGPPGRPPPAYPEPAPSDQTTSDQTTSDQTASDQTASDQTASDQAWWWSDSSSEDEPRSR